MTKNLSNSLDSASILFPQSIGYNAKIVRDYYHREPKKNLEVLPLLATNHNRIDLEHHVNYKVEKVKGRSEKHHQICWNLLPKFPLRKSNNGGSLNGYN